ncbi:unnamed protein product [Brachionus calyciflorus]|uniref:RRM domain-containing protein n=1 Tax=Brachionus calyciflorus TaxID=104777 RepID=A0A813M625_9BILA|nr:unnamed protein product [Brachionus calyciflorus]
MVSITQKDTTFTKIFVGGLPYHTTDDTLRKFFERFGDIEEAVVITDRATGKSRGYGFVTMLTKESAQEAIKDPNPVIDGRKANVNLAYLGAKPRTATGLTNVAAAAAAANTVFHLGAYPGLQPYGLQQLIYPAHTLLGANVLQYPGSATSLSPSAAHYGTGVYDFASQYNPTQLDAVNFPYGSQAVAAAAAAAGLGSTNQSNAAANYAYAALAQQSIPSLTAAYQQ